MLFIYGNVSVNVTMFCYTAVMLTGLFVRKRRESYVFMLILVSPLHIRLTFCVVLFLVHWRIKTIESMIIEL